MDVLGRGFPILCIYLPKCPMKQELRELSRDTVAHKCLTSQPSLLSYMKLGKFRQSKFGLMTAICVLLTVLLIGMIGGFRPLDTAFQSLCQRMGFPCARAEHVLIIYAPQETLASGSDELIELLDEIHKHSPNRVGIVAGGPPQLYQRLDQLSYAEQLCVGFRFNQLLSSTAGKVSANFQTGFSDLPFSEDPVLRYGTTRREQVGIVLPSFEASLVEPLIGSNYKLPSENFGITWCGGSGSIAHIRSRHLTSGNSIRALIQGRVVLIGPDYPDEFAVSVPPTSGGSRMSRLEVRANIVECLLQNSYTLSCSQAITLMWLLCATVLSIQIARQTPIHQCGLALSLIVTGIVIACAIGVWLSNFWISVSALVVASSLAWLTTTLHRFGRMSDFVQYWKLRSIVREAHLESRFEEGVWNAIGDSALQMFQPTRMVLMELSPGATHLKRVSSVGCDYSHILEKRLDYRRSPYIEAIEENRPILNPRGNFFSRTPGLREAEFVLPLSNGLTTLGIIVLGMDKEHLAQWADFQTFLEKFTIEMSQLVAASRQELVNDLSRLDWRERLRKLPEEVEFIEIQRSSERQNDLIERSELAFDSSESAMATFDIYGRVIRRNSSFNRIMQEAQLSISRILCVEILASLTGRSQNECRNIFREAIMNDREDEILMVDKNRSRSPRVMYVKPMRLIEEERRTSIETHGLLIEIVDGSPFEDLERWNHQLSQSLVPKALETVEHLSSKKADIRALVESEMTPQETLKNLFGTVGSTVDEIVSVLQQCKDLTNRQVSADVENGFAFDSNSVWNSVHQRVTPALADRSIEIINKIDQSARVIVFANPLLLERVFGTTIEFLAENALDESQIGVEVHQAEGEIEWQFINQGGGTPVDTLRRALEAEEVRGRSTNVYADRENIKKQKALNLSPLQIDQLSEIEAWVNRWGGSVEVKNLPESMTVSIHLTTSARSATLTNPAPTTHLRK